MRQKSAPDGSRTLGAFKKKQKFKNVHILKKVFEKFNKNIWIFKTMFAISQIVTIFHKLFIFF